LHSKERAGYDAPEIGREVEMGPGRGVFMVAVLAAIAALATSSAAADEPSTLAFSEDAVTVARSEGAATLTVLRTGDTTQEAGATVTGSEGFEGRVTIPAGAGSGTIEVPLPDSIAPGGFVTWTLSDPSGGSLIGEPSTLQMTVYEDVADPEPAPNRAPDTTITRARATRIAGRAMDPEHRIARVELSVLQRMGHKCRRVKPNGRLGRRGSCAASYRAMTTGAKRWSFHPSRRLPAGRYVVRARTVDAAGLRDPSPAKRTFRIR
jgi:hypothetical protein